MSLGGPSPEGRPRPDRGGHRAGGDGPGQSERGDGAPASWEIRPALGCKHWFTVKVVNVLFYTLTKKAAYLKMLENFSKPNKVQ